MIEAVCLGGLMLHADYKKLLNNRRFLLAAAVFFSEIDYSKWRSVYVGYETSTYSWLNRTETLRRIIAEWPKESAKLVSFLH